MKARARLIERKPSDEIFGKSSLCVLANEEHAVGVQAPRRSDPDAVFVDATRWTARDDYGEPRRGVESREAGKLISARFNMKPRR